MLKTFAITIIIKEPYNGLAGDNSRGMTMKLGVLIKNPSHCLSISTHVRSRDIGVNTDEIMDLLSEDTCKSLELAQAQVTRVASDPTFSSTVRNVSDSCLPSHELSQCVDFIGINLYKKPKSLKL